MGRVHGSRGYCAGGAVVSFVRSACRTCETDHRGVLIDRLIDANRQLRLELVKLIAEREQERIAFAACDAERLVPRREKLGTHDWEPCRPGLNEVD